MAKKLPAKEVPTKVIITEEQHPVPVVITAPDGVTPVPVPSLGIEANTPPGASVPVLGYTPDGAVTPVATLGGTVGNPEGAAPVTAPQATTTTTVTAPVPTTVSKSEELTLAPTTTVQQDIVTAGQRFTSNVWELTQASVAVMVTLAMIYTAIMQIESLVLTSAFFLIIGTYFNRTNSHRIGGVGPKATDNQPYLGR